MEQILDLYKQEYWRFYWKEYIPVFLIWCLLVFGISLLVFNLIFRSLKPGKKAGRFRTLVNIIGILLPLALFALDYYSSIRHLNQKTEVRIVASNASMKSTAEKRQLRHPDIYPKSLASSDGPLTPDQVKAELYVALDFDSLPIFQGSLWQNRFYKTPWW